MLPLPPDELGEKQQQEEEALRSMCVLPSPLRRPDPPSSPYTPCLPRRNKRAWSHLAMSYANLMIYLPAVVMVMISSQLHRTSPRLGAARVRSAAASLAFG